jgi:hypothetical protein
MVRKKALLIIVALAALLIRSDGQTPRPLAEQFRLARLFPRGALVYLQVRDLSALLRRWLASPIRKRFYESKGFEAFSKSRIYLKLEARKKDIERAVGFGLSEELLATIWGGASAISIYDIGNTELMFVTEVRRAVLAALFKQLTRFQEQTANGVTYYSAEFVTDEGRLSQQFCFAYARGRLIATTSERLMIMALSIKGQEDSLLGQISEAASRIADFSASDLTLWADVSRLTANRYFKNYWIYGNASELSKIESGLVDLRLAADGIVERRWFVAKSDLPNRRLTVEQLRSLLGFVPEDAHLASAEAETDAATLSQMASRALLPKLPPETEPPREVAAVDQTRDRHEGRIGRPLRLDSRFDSDIDDDQAPTASKAKRAAAEPQRDQFAERLEPILAACRPSGHCQIVRSISDPEDPFIRFERAIVIQTREAFDSAALEQIIAEEAKSRLMLAGTKLTLEWKSAGSVRYLEQPLFEMSPAYAIAGRYIILASSQKMAREVAGAARGAPAPEAGAGYYAIVRIGRAMLHFQGLMSKLEAASEEKYFSEDLSSLISASMINQVQITRWSEGSLLRERAVYSW